MLSVSLINTKLNPGSNIVFLSSFDHHVFMVGKSFGFENKSAIDVAAVGSLIGGDVGGDTCWSSFIMFFMYSTVS